MRGKGLLLVVALVAAIAPAHAAPPPPATAVDRSTDPVVLTGAQFPSWSAGPDVSAREPQPVTYYSNGVDPQPNAGPAQSDCYKKTAHPNPYDYSDRGDHNCYQSSRAPNNPREGAKVNRLLGYRWDGTKFAQIPLQVDERFTRYITNNESGFAFYSGVDQETTYAWDREGFRYTSDEFLANGGDPCRAHPAPGSTMVNGFATTLDPVKGLDDNDELSFMYRDAGALAPVGAALPAGIESSYRVALADPSNPAAVAYAYVMLANAAGPAPAFDTSNGYVRYARDANADMYAYSQSGSGTYGRAQNGPYCNADGTIATTNDPNYHPPAGIDHPSNWLIKQRRPLDGAWVKTDRYAFRYDGRWLMTQLRISGDATGLSSANYGPDIVDQWKARAFQQRPGDPNDPAAGHTPCCGYEEEVYNWGGSSILFGERVGPVRAIRAAWGADSSTNNVRTETFYREQIRFADNLRVHVIPPFDGIYVQWDYNAGKVSTYYNPLKPGGVKIDGQNDEVFGNTKVHLSNDRVEVRDDDPIPGVGAQDIAITLDPSADRNSCSMVCNDLDFADPAFSGPSGVFNWEEVAGPNGTLVTRWGTRQHSAGDAYSIIAQPYYRDDSCFDDGTGNDPGPHLNIRHADAGPFSMWTDPATGVSQKRTCWQPGDGITGDPAVDARYVQGDIATHGLHIQLIADSDNAQLTQPIDEIDSEQHMVVLPGDQGNVGERYGRNAVELALQTTVTPNA
jgi:hypothetical protein